MSSTEEEAEIRNFQYFAFGNNPIKITLIDGIPAKAEVIDLKTKAFKIDNKVIPRIMHSLEVEEITSQEFRNLCLAMGVKPI